jgi:hypothetical protein
LKSPTVEGQKVLDEAGGMRDSHINRTHVNEDGTKVAVEPFVGNQAVRAVNDADSQMKERIEKRKSSGKLPLEGD